MGEIRFDFDAAGQASRQTEDIAGRLSKDILPGFQDILQQINRSWQSAAGGRFLDTACREQEKLEETRRMAEYAAASLREAVLTAEKTEEQTKEIAESRTY